MSVSPTLVYVASSVAFLVGGVGIKTLLDRYLPPRPQAPVAPPGRRRPRPVGSLGQVFEEAPPPRRLRGIEEGDGLPPRRPGASLETMERLHVEARHQAGQPPGWPNHMRGGPWE